MKLCDKCGRSNTNNAGFCIGCGAPFISQSALAQARKKRKTGCIVGLSVLALLIIIMIAGTMQVIQDQDQNAKQASNVIFNAAQYEVQEDGTNISEYELIDQLGEPDSTEDWNYESSDGTYPVRTLYYGTYEYNFNNDNLQRITINETIPYTNKDDFIKMFGLTKGASTSINDTGVAYRAYSCGINDLWIIYNDSNITQVKISYGTVFE